MNEFHIDDVPETTTISGFIDKHSDMQSAISKFKNFDSLLRVKPISSDILNKLWESVKESFDIYGWYGFLLGNFNSNTNKRSTMYGGFSITYNINHWQDLPINCQTLGNQRYNLEDIFDDDLGKKIWDNLVLNENSKKFKSIFYDKVEKNGLYHALDFLFENEFLTKDQYLEKKSKYINCVINPDAVKQRKKNTYSDTFGYSWRTPASKHGFLGKFLDSSNRTHVRGRVVTLKYPLNVHWHTDENIFYNTRVNIPIYSEISCKAFIEGQPSFINDPGYMYSWNTELPHKIDIIKGNGERTSIVCGFSPWWDFVEEEKIWKKNQFYGQAHPLEMFEKNYLLNLNNI